MNRRSFLSVCRTVRLMGVLNRWAERHYLNRQTARSVDVSARADPTSRAYVQRIFARAYHLSHADQEAAAIPLYREVIEHPQAGSRYRGLSASWLGWLLLNRYPGDPVPDETRRLLAIATHERPRHCMTLLLRAYVLAHDDDGEGSLRAVKQARRRATGGRDPRLVSTMLGIEAIAHAKLGRIAEAAQLRDEAAQLWPKCDILVAVDASINDVAL